jgi:hypothetical protein
VMGKLRPGEATQALHGRRHESVSSYAVVLDLWVSSHCLLQDRP